MLKLNTQTFDNFYLASLTYILYFIVMILRAASGSSHYMSYQMPELESNLHLQNIK